MPVTKPTIAELLAKVNNVSLYDVKDGHGAPPPDGLSKPLKPYESVPVETAKAGHLVTVAAGEASGIGGALKSLEDTGQYAMWTSRMAAVQGVAAGYWDQVKADATAGIPRSRLIFVEDQKASAQFARESEKVAEKRDIVKKDSAVQIRQHSGKSTLAPGQRIIATGAFNQADKEKGIAAGESGAILAIGKHPTDVVKNPGTYATVQIDGVNGEKGRTATLRVATPDDYFRKEVFAAKTLHREDIPIASKEDKGERSGLHWVPGLNSEHIQSLSVARTTVIASKTLTSDDLLQLVGKTKGGIELHSTNALGDAAKLTEKVKAADEKLHGSEMDIDSTSAQAGWAEARKKIEGTSMYEVKEGHGAAPATGLSKPLKPYEPVPVETAKTGHLATIIAMDGDAGIGGALKSLEDTGQYAMWTSRMTAVQGVAAGYWNQVKADADAGLPRSRLIFVEDQKASAQFVRESEKVAEKHGFVKKDSAVQVRQHSGKSTLAPGQRIVATGAFNQANKEKGIAAGESGVILEIGKHPTDVVKNPGTYATVQIDGIDGKEGRTTTLRVATPDDYFRKDVFAAKTLHREDIPIASKEDKGERSGLHWVPGLNSEHIQSLSVARTTIIASKTLTSSDLLELMGKTKGGIELHSTVALGDAAALAEKVRAADEKIHASEMDIDATAEARQDNPAQKTGLHKVAGQPSLTVVQGGRSGENRQPIRRLGSRGALSQEAGEERLDQDTAMHGVPIAPTTGKRNMDDRAENDRVAGSGGRR